MRSRERADQQHHVVAAIQTLLYDTNSLDAENTEALVGARKAVELIKELPPLVRFIPASSLFLLFLLLLAPSLFTLPAHWIGRRYWPAMTGGKIRENTTDCIARSCC